MLAGDLGRLSAPINALFFGLVGASLKLSGEWGAEGAGWMPCWLLSGLAGEAEAHCGGVLPAATSKGWHQLALCTCPPPLTHPPPTYLTPTLPLALPCPAPLRTCSRAGQPVGSSHPVCRAPGGGVVRLLGGRTRGGHPARRRPPPVDGHGHAGKMAVWAAPRGPATNCCILQAGPHRRGAELRLLTPLLPPLLSLACLPCRRALPWGWPRRWLCASRLGAPTLQASKRGSPGQPARHCFLPCCHQQAGSLLSAMHAFAEIPC